MPYPDKPILKQTSTEFLLFIHPAEKERAKVIGGYRWDTQRKCWVYPSTKRVYDALIAEFGDQLLVQPGAEPLPKPPPAEPLEDFRKKYELVAEENKRLEAKIVELSKTSVSQPEIQQLRTDLTKRDTELSELRRRLVEAQEEHEKVRREADNLRAELKRRDADRSIQTHIKAMALEATGNDGKFAALLEQLDFSTNMPLKLARILERELRRLLGIPEDDRTVDLNELLQQARDADILPRDAIDLAHLIRKQRNVIAHADKYEKTYQARAIMCLFASALLWPEFPE